MRPFRSLSARLTVQFALLFAAAMLAAKREWGPMTGLVELLHVSSKRHDREEVGIKPLQRQTQLQAALRMHW